MSADQIDKESGTGTCGCYEFDIRWAVLPCDPGRRAAREECRSDSFRRGLVRLCPVQPAVPRPVRDAEGSTTTRRPHRIGDPVHPQTPRSILTGIHDPCTEGPFSCRARTFQRSVHDAHLDIPVLPDHRLARCFIKDDGRSIGDPPDNGMY